MFSEAVGLLEQLGFKPSIIDHQVHHCTN